MKVYPIHKALGWDYLFFYTIDFLFLTQIKGISAAQVMLKSTFYSFFSIMLQIPANIIIEFLGRKNSIVLGNVLNCIYMLILMLSRNFVDIVFAEFIGALAFAIKDIAQPSLLNQSIPPSKFKSRIYAKINASGATGYYLLNSLSKILAGFLFTINGYLPIIFSFVTLIIATIISAMLIEPRSKKRKNINEILGSKQVKDIRDGFVYILRSERLKALILCSSLLVTLLVILQNYYVSLFENLNISSVYIGIIAAIGSLVSSFASQKQETYHKKFRNRSLFTIAILLSVSTWIAGLCGVKADGYLGLILVIIMAYIVYQFCYGMYYALIDKYLRNFTNKHIDTKIFATKNLFGGITRVIGGLFASFLLDKMLTAYCMIIMGAIFTLIYILIGKYMNSRVGLKPEQYSDEEVKYDEQRIV